MPGKNKGKMGGWFYREPLARAKKTEICLPTFGNTRGSGKGGKQVSLTGRGRFYYFCQQTGLRLMRERRRRESSKKKNYRRGSHGLFGGQFLTGGGVVYASGVGTTLRDQPGGESEAPVRLKNRRPASPVEKRTVQGQKKPAKYFLKPRGKKILRRIRFGLHPAETAHLTLRVSKRRLRA